MDSLPSWVVIVLVAGVVLGIAAVALYEWLNGRRRDHDDTDGT
jgi:uncharacterized protein involved in exopolysaccharide biosynthesis